MNRDPRRVDLSFLNEEEAKQIFRVLERDSQLKRAEKERISKLHKEKEDATGLPGVTGDWFEEIQKRKFQNEADVGKMFKQPLVHRLRKSIGNDAKPSAPPIPQAQKNASPSILGGLRMPFASLFSSFRKSKRQHSKPLQKQPQYPPRYDPFAAGSHMSSKVEEMATIETCDSPLPSELANKGLDANQAEMTDDSTCTWNEQLENELLRVLGSLDDQLAQEQTRGEAGNRRTPADSASRAPDIDPYSTLTRPGFLGGVQRNERSMFLSDGTRTLRATDDHKALFRPRVPCDTYTKRQRVKDGTYGDVYGRSSPVLKRGNSTRSLGHSSEGSLHLPLGQRSSGFGHKDFTPRDSVGRSYSLSCLARRPSLTSVDQLSPASPQHPLEGNRVFAPRNYRQHPRRTPLSSIVWNTPPPSEHPVYPDGLLRTQSLMEFGPVFEDTYPCSLQKDTRYEFYRTKVNYRRAVPVMGNPVFAEKHTDPLGFDNRENFLLHQLGMSASKPRYRYPSFHGRMSLPRKSFPSGRIEERLLTPTDHHYYNDEVFVGPDADVERIPLNPRNWQGAYAKKMGERDAQSRVSDYIRRHMDRSEGIRNKPFAKHAEGMQSCPALDLSVRNGQAEYASQRQNPFVRAGQASSKALAKHFETKRNFKAEEERGADRMDKMDSEATLRLISDPVDTHSPADSSMPPCKNSSAVDSQSCTSLKPPHSLCSKSDSITDTGNSYLSNIHNRTGRRNEGDCAINSDLDQTTPPQLTANNPRTSILHLLEREGRAVESLGALTPNKTPGNICLSALSRGPKMLFDNELPHSCTENFNKCNRFVKHTTSNSVTGSPSNSPPKSPVTYCTLPRKSASIDGSLISEKPISSAARQIFFKNNRAVGDNLETTASNRMGGKFPNQRAKSFLLNSAHSSLSPSPKDVSCNLSPAKGNPSLITQESSKSVGSNNTKGRSTIIQSPDKTEISVLSECEGTDAGNPLKQYKTTSTLTVSIEEDNVKYHELISVYYTLPRKQSRTLSNLFLDDNQSTDSSPPKGKFELPQKKYEVRIGLGRVAFPSSLEKEGKADSPGKMAATPDLSQNAKTSDDANKEDCCVTERAGASPSLLHNREGVLGSPAETPDLAFSKRVVSHGPSGDPKPSETMNESVSATTTSRQCKVHIFKFPSQQQKESKVDSPLSHSSSNTTDIRQDVEVKERACYRGPSISKKGNGLQSRSENIGSSTDEAFISEAKVHSKFQNQTLQVDATSTVDPAIRPNQSSLEYAKKQKEMLRNSLLHKDCTNAQRLVRNSAENSKDQAAGTAQDLPDSSETENKLILDSTKDKASDIEKRKNRPSIKNKLAAMYKTSRKFSSKKTSSPKPHIGNIFSQNNAPLEISHPHSMLISPDGPPSLLQAGNENQNRNPLADEFDNMVLDKPDSKKPQTNEGPPLLTNEVRRPFTNLCNQKRESPRIETPQNPTALFPKGSMSTSSNSQTDDGLENISCSVPSKIIFADSKQMKKDVVNVGEHLFSPLSSDNTSNILNKSYSKICPPQKMTSPTEYDHHPNIKEPNRLRKLSRPYIEPVLNPSKAQRERHFSESSYTRAPCDRLASRSNLISHGSRYNRKFKSHSELLSCDENENWETDNESYKTFGSRRVLYPSIEFGIFGKEQQQAFLDNIKRSLTEGRLWSPCLLKNSSSLRKEEDCSLNRSQLLSSGSAEKNTSAGDSRPNEPVDVHGEDPTDYSDSDSSTTTDDEYYLEENDKESEL
ncbi:exophilin-5 isoform X2 [Podarcis lilfordi]|uniref:Exophilin-5 isoform X2 n=2 Tax=Podarcis lilfordi TaxID=74358 RepID=A0AA35P2K2_9SAUR|nr:exophilin-5 isoform X2 [Podarcis lilfordi]